MDDRGGDSHGNSRVDPVDWADTPADVEAGSHTLLQAVIEGTSDAVYIKDRQGRYLLFNSAAAIVVGRRAEEVIGKDDKVEALFFSSVDVTERTRAEARLRTSLGEKEVLLKEVHHRVKNNLQFVSSLLALQAARIKDRQITSAIKESQQRIRAMALMHEQLYRGPNLASVPIARHLTALCADLYRSYSVDPDRIALDLRVADVSLDLDRSIRCGLIVNELVSNAILHAFPDGREGRITVRLDADDDHYELAVSDNGVGLPAEVDPLQTESLGLQLVADLADQLGAGAPSVARDGQTLFVVRFPAGNGDARS
jgi:two-component sensor histidine kinase